MMSGKQPAGGWWITGVSVRGASHVRNNLPNQDAIAWRTLEGAVLMAVADGHGSPRYVRSHQGAKLAVRVALDELERFLADGRDPAGIKRRAEEQLPRTLVRSWQAEVLQKLADAPLTEEEMAVLERIGGKTAQSDEPELRPGPETRPGAPAATETAERPQRVFGATLLATVLTRRFGLYLQLGDGDIVTVDSRGKAAHVPLEADARLIANQTTSLAGRNAWQDVRVYFQPFVKSPPVLAMLATDGYANSFEDGSGVLSAAEDFYALLHQHGPNYIERRLGGWLATTSKQGSGDDISVGLVAPNL